MLNQENLVSELSLVQSELASFPQGSFMYQFEKFAFKPEFLYSLIFKKFFQQTAVVLYSYIVANLSCMSSQSL